MSIKSRYFILIIIIFAITVSSIWLYEGHFLLKKTADKPVTKAEEVRSEAPEPQPVQYTHVSTVIDGNKQEINILEIDLHNPKIELKPVLSYDSIFGFEKLSVMYNRSKAFAAVNAGFFYEFGNPAGMVAVDGKLITKSTGKYPVLFIDRGEAVLKQLDTSIWAEYDGKKIGIKDINAYGNLQESVLFTPDFGTDNRVVKKNISLIIENNMITGIKRSNTKTEIPKNGMVLTFLEPVTEDFTQADFKTGEKIGLTYEPILGNSTQAYECGSWIVKNGQVVVGDRDDWVGVLTNWDPRTAVGIKKDGKVVLLTVDGRQPGVSMGLTAKELGKYFVGMGVKDAAMLDGGASTEMIVDGKMVSKPSYKGSERLIGGAIVVKVGN